jgi:hypothetical protein
LLALTAAVLAVHGWLLRPAPGAFQPAARERARPLFIRTVAAPAMPLEAAAASPAPPPPRVAAPVQRPAVRSSPVQVPPRPQSPPAPSASPAATLVAADAPPAKASAAPGPGRVDNLAFAIPGSVLLHYEVTAHTRGLVLRAASQLHWRHDGSEYEAKLELSGPLFPARTQQSTGRITPQGLAPLRFSDKARSEEAAHFQREEGKVSFSSNRPDAALSAGAQDRLSVLMQLGAMIAGQPRNFGPGTTISIQTASTRDAEVWQFTVEGDEALQLPGGAVPALKLIRNARREFDQKIELWLAPGMAYVPVRLRLTQPNGDWVDQQWSSTDKG